MDVHALTEDDWELLQAMRLAALSEAPRVFGASAYREESFRETHWRMRLRSSPTWVAVHDNASVGMVSMIMEPGSPLDDRHMVSLWVEPNSRRQAVASTLVSTVAHAAWTDGARTLSVWIADDNVPGRAFALRSGFKATNERHAIQPDEVRTEERYALDLAASLWPN